MSAYAESTASFRHRASEVGLTPADIRSLDDQGIKSFNNLAFSVCSQPGQIDDVRFRALVDGTFTNPSLGVESMMRQLSYEALTIAVAAIRQRVEVPAEGQLRRLPPQERDERMRRQAKRITGFTIQGEYEPAHSVVDFFTTMLEESAPRYLPLSKCISREQELQTLKTDKRIVMLEDQQLVTKPKAPDVTADLSSDLKVQNAFIRRGLACEQANLLTYTTHEKIRHAFMAHLMRTPPPGFKGADIGAVLRADKELWMRAFELCKSNLKVDENGKHPLDDALLGLYTSPEVVFHLLPVPQSSSSTKKSEKSEPADRSRSPRRSNPPKQNKPPKKPFNKNKGQDKRVKVPTALSGHSGTNGQGQRICYNFNLKHGCSNSTHTKDGQLRCVKGNHQCIKCFKDHPVHERTKH